MARQIVTPKLLTKIRKLNLRIMPDTATVYTGTQASDGRGGTTTTWAAGTSYECRFRPANYYDQQQLMGGQAMSAPLFVAVLPFDAVVNEADRLRINDIDYEIVGWLGNKTYKVGTRIGLKEVDPETARDNV